MLKVMFLCTGNTCRSPMALFLFKDILNKKGLGSRVAVDSAGLAAFDGDPIAEAAKEVLIKKWGIDASEHRAKALLLDRLMQQDMIVTMTEDQAQYFRKQIPEVSARVSTLIQAAVSSQAALSRLPDTDASFRESVSFNPNALNIADPYGRPQAVYEATAEEIRSYLLILAEYIEWQLQQRA